MNNQHFIALTIAYLWIALAYGSVFLFDYSAQIRGIILFFSAVPVAIMHIASFYSGTLLQPKRYFLALTILWVIKVTVFAINEGLHYFASGLPLLDWVDLFLLLSICLFVSLSFIIGRPFFFKQIRNKAIVFLGIAGLFMAAGLAVMIGLAISDVSDFRSYR